MKEITIDNQKYFAFSESEYNELNFRKTKNNTNIKYPYILSFREKIDNKLLFNWIGDDRYGDCINDNVSYSLDNMLFGLCSVEDDYLEIFEVAINNNENLKLNSNIFIDNEFIYETIKFEYYNDYLCAKLKCLNGTQSNIYFNLENDWNKITLIDCLLITEDGVNIIDSSQIIYGVCTKAQWETRDLSVSHILRSQNNEYSSSFNKDVWKFFSTEIERKKYIKKRKPLYSINNIEDIWLELFGEISSMNFKNFIDKLENGK